MMVLTYGLKLSPFFLCFSSLFFTYINWHSISCFSTSSFTHFYISLFSFSLCFFFSGFLSFSLSLTLNSRFFCFCYPFFFSFFNSFHFLLLILQSRLLFCLFSLPLHFFLFFFLPRNFFLFYFIYFLSPIIF